MVRERCWREEDEEDEAGLLGVRGVKGPRSASLSLVWLLG